MAFLARKTLSRSKCVDIFMTQNIKKLLQVTQFLWVTKFQTQKTHHIAHRDRRGRNGNKNVSCLGIFFDTYSYENGEHAG